MKKYSFLTAALTIILLLTVGTVSAAQGSGNECVVTTTEDQAPGSLRDCLLNASSGVTILFDETVFPESDPARIMLESTLPDLSVGEIVIDASGVGVVLDGSNLNEGVGLHIVSSKNIIKGLQIINFPNDGIYIHSGAQENIIGGNNATPGGQCSGDCNLISGNRENGIAIREEGTNNNIVSGNYIGTDIAGEEAYPNFRNGVSIGESASGNIIGGDTPEERNIISGNGADDWGPGPPPAGVGFYSAVSNTVVGNYIGADASGEKAIPNKKGIIAFGASQDNIIGDNLISGNSMDGISIQGDNAARFLIQRNYIGTNKSGTEPLPNSESNGITIQWGDHHLIQENVIAYNFNGGLVVSGNLANSGVFGVTISKNRIYANRSFGISVVSTQETILPPKIVAASDHVVTGAGEPNATVELFSDDGYQAELYLGLTMADENGEFRFEIPQDVLLRKNVTATITDGNGNTSNLSSPVTIEITPHLEVTEEIEEQPKAEPHTSTPELEESARPVNLPCASGTVVLPLLLIGLRYFSNLFKP